MKTMCTDGDWVWVLMELSKILPEYFVEVIKQIKDVSLQRVEEWHMGILLWESQKISIFCFTSIGMIY